MILQSHKPFKFLNYFYAPGSSVRLKFSFTDEMFRRNLLLSDKIVELIFVIVKTNVFGIHGGRLVVGLFYIFPYFCFGKIIILCKDSIDSE